MSAPLRQAQQWLASYEALPAEDKQAMVDTAAGHLRTVIDLLDEVPKTPDTVLTEAIRDLSDSIRGRTDRRHEWDTNTADEADAFEKVAMAVLGISPGDLHKEPIASRIAQLIAAYDHDGCADAEAICETLVEVGGWPEIDGDGTNTSLITDHINRLVKTAEDGVVPPIGKGIVVAVRHVGGDGDPRYMVMVDEMVEGAHGTSVTIHPA